ncbi:VOC family protein [Pseudalkalibacillus berkeleyi]|uniref:VOC family protein n=1 Tax=Pseudalkalibacillus berkeleyi TaxID=1069813 RepID=A0ABS9GWS6_9BACL|nr:VOC family protein [Pseudalkalibacillus berkeleyi]MCF6136125.1 VOC family protein [Pseudalkalibacillus berkeleyi]
MNITGINHITLNVRSLKESLAFYEDILLMKRVHLGRTDAYLESGTAWICLLEKGKDEKDDFSSKLGLDHFAFSIDEKGFHEVVRRLHINEVQIVRGPVERGGGLVVNFLDPNGIQLELNTSDLHTRMKHWQ